MGAKQSSNTTNEIDLSSYLTQDDANSLYQVKPPEDDEFVLKTYADDTYKFPEDYVSKNELSAYLLEDEAKKIYQELPPKGDQFVLKSYTDQLNRLTSNYATVDELNKYITQTSANSLYQPKGSYATLQSNGDLNVNRNIYSVGSVISESPMWNKSNDFLLGINNDRGNFSNNVTSGRALVKDANSTLVMNFAGDFGGGVRIDGRNGLNVNGGPITITGRSFKVGGNANTFYPIAVDTTLSWRTSNIYRCNISRSAVHEDAERKGAFSMMIEGHADNWGNGGSFIRYKLVNNPWNDLTYKNFVGNVAPHNSSVWIIIFLRGDTTYSFSGEGCTLAFENTAGVTSYKVPVGDQGTFTAITAPVAPFGATNVYYDSADNTYIVNGRMGIGTNNPQDTLDVNGDIKTGNLKITRGWSNFASYNNNSEISNDTDTFKTLMIVGNTSGGGGIRRVGIWDQLDVNAKLCFGPGKCISKDTPGISWSS